MHETFKKEFTHLKIHTQFSICEGALKTADLAKFCKENKVRAAGLSDSNNIFTGNSWFWKYIKKDLNYYVVEVYDDDIGKVKKCYQLLNNKLEIK